MCKRILSVLLALLMLLTLMPVGALAEGETSGSLITMDDMTYKLENGVLTVSGEGACSNEWKNSFDQNAVTKVVIESGVTGIVGDAFYNCPSLVSVTIPESVTFIGFDAFRATAYYNDEANWENGALYIGDCLIDAKEGISGVYAIKNGTRLVADYAFSGCASLEGVAIPDSVTSIGDGVFSGCMALENVEVSEGNVNYISLDGVLYDSDQFELIFCSRGKTGSFVVPDSVMSIAGGAFDGCTGLTSITLSDNVDSFGDFAFAGCTGLKSVTYQGMTYALENGVLTVSGEGGCSDIWKYVLDASAVTKVVISDGATYIGSSAFSWCENMASVTIPDTVSEIGSSAFSGCTSLASITMPDGIESINHDAFSNTAYFNDETNWENGVLYIGSCLISAKEDISGECTIKDGTKLIANYAFYGCAGMTGVTIPNSVTHIGDYAFYGCAGLTNVTIPDNVESIYYNTFEECTSLASFTYKGFAYALENGTLTVSGEGECTDDWEKILDSSTITEVVIKDGVTSIGDSAFYGCDSLASVTIPDSVTSIGDGAFSDCPWLSRIEVAEGNANYSSVDGVLYNKDKTKLILCPEGKTGSLVVPDGVTDISDATFHGCTSLESVTIPDSVTSIGIWAFYCCTSLASITIPDSVTSIGDSAFRDCTSLESITIPGGVTSIGDSAFYNTAYYNDVANWENGVLYIGSYLIEAKASISGALTIKDGIRSVADGAFTDCTELTSVTIPDSVTSIGDYAFRGCVSLEKVVLPAGITNVADYIFTGCTSLASITIPDGVTSIGNWAFDGCTSLESVTIPDGVTYIGDQVFEDCTNLAEVSMPESVENIRADVFKNTAYYNNEANWENGVLYIGKSLMNAKSDLSGAYKVKDNTKVLAASSLAGTAIESAEIPASVTEIAYGLFQNCASLKSVTLPDTIQSIGMLAFSGCESLTDVYYGGTQAQWDAIDIHRASCYPTDATIHFTEQHTHSYTDVVTKPTCTEKGYTTHTCACGESFVDSYVNALGHDTEIRNAKAATATEKGYTGDEVCKVCGVTVKTGSEIPALGEPHIHSYTDVVTKPTCTEKGYTTHTCACGESFVDSYVNALGHDTEIKNAKAASCTDKGYTGDEVCKTCGETVKTGSEIAAKGHKYENGKCIRCGEADPNADKPSENPFTDVTSEKYFYAPVMWAVNHDPQITGGYTDGTFRPQNTCTRAQIVTFIWRAKGCPEPASTSCTFTDVAPGAYYYKAVLWAVESGITGGYNEYTFGSNDTVTRAQAMTFLWRAAGKPAAPAGTVNTFTDVSSTSYYYNAVMWAVANGITGGYNAGVFGSNDGCTRGQIVTFLYRNMA